MTALLKNAIMLSNYKHNLFSNFLTFTDFLFIGMLVGAILAKNAYLLGMMPSYYYSF